MNGFTYKYRGADSQVRRTFACTSCGIEWTLWQEREAVFPDCPMCALEARQAIAAPALLTDKARAVDFAQETMERMGYTDFNDNQRVGDIAVKAPSPVQTSEAGDMMQRAAELTRALEVPALSTVSPGGVPSQAEMANSFWGGGMPGVPAALAPQVGAAFQGAAMANARLTRAEGFDPMALLHQKKPPFKLDIVAATNRRPAS